MKPWMPESLLGSGDIAGHRREDLWNALIALIASPVALGGGAGLSVTPGAAPASGTRLMRIETGARLGSVLVELLAFPFDELTGSALAAGDVAALPDPLADAVCRGVVSVLAGFVPAAWGIGTPQLSGFDHGDQASIDQWFEATVAAPGLSPIVLRAGLSRDRLLARLADPAFVGAAFSGPLGRGGEGPLAAALSIPADITIGRLALTATELRALEPGDVVVMAAAPEGAVFLRIGGRLFTFLAADGHYVCRGSEPLEQPRPATFKAETRAMTDDQAPLPDHDGNPSGAPRQTDPHPGGLSDLVLAVDFDLGRIDLPVAAVAAWTPGMVIDMQQPSLDAGVSVTLRVNGQPVGTGDIVRIDDRIGVRITRLIS